MTHIFSKYKLQLIKEDTKQYDANVYINSPEDVKKILKNVIQLDKESEEVFCVIALNCKNKVLGTFEVSRGTIDNSLVSGREVAKRIVLLNAAKFISAHNHPSGNIEPSSADIEISNNLTKLGYILNIKHLDFVIIGYDEILSFREESLL